MELERPNREKVEIIDLKPKRSDFLEDVQEGLGLEQKAIKPIYFYDVLGSQIFYKICETKEYYPTRMDMEILFENSTFIARHMSKRASLVELGGGGSKKVSPLLSSGYFNHYIPIDISSEALIETASEVSSDFPEVDVSCVVADFTLADFDCSIFHYDTEKLVFFPGSTIGNLSPLDRVSLLSRVRTILSPEGGYFLVGIDLVKPTKILESAYNDFEGHTAAFNMNLLSRANRELNANFNLKAFKHRAFFNHDKSRIEMHLESLVSQQVMVGSQVFQFEKGETIHTENSYKFEVGSFVDVARGEGFEFVEAWYDDQEYFAEILFRVPPLS